MADGKGDRAYGFDDNDLAVLPTVYGTGSFAGKTALISGGAGGIGRATAWLLGRLGARIVICGRDEAKLAGAVDAMRGGGITVSSHVIDIRKPELVDTVMSAIVEETGGFDILVNSAGGQFPQAAIDFSVKGWNTVIATNLDGTWFMMQAAAKRWREAKRRGSIVNIVVVTERGLYGVAHTVAARAGVIGLSQNLAVEWAQHGIRINCVAPGAIETKGWNVYSPEAVATYSKGCPMMEVGTAWDVAEAVAYLGGAAGRFVTGEVLHVAGGGELWGDTWTIQKPDYFKR